MTIVINGVGRQIWNRRQLEKNETMKTKPFLFNIGQVLWTATAISLCAAGSLQGQTDRIAILQFSSD